MECFLIYSYRCLYLNCFLFFKKAIITEWRVSHPQQAVNLEDEETWGMKHAHPRQLKQTRLLFDRMDVYRAGRGNVVQRWVGLCIASVVTLCFYMGPVHVLITIYFACSGQYHNALIGTSTFLIMCCTPSLAIRKVTSSNIFHCVHHYFDYEYIQEHDSANQKSQGHAMQFDEQSHHTHQRQILYAVTPHGAVSVGGLCWGIFLSREYPQEPLTYTAVASIMIWFPYVKHIIGLFPILHARCEFFILSEVRRINKLVLIIYIVSYATRSYMEYRYKHIIFFHLFGWWKYITDTTLSTMRCCQDIL